MAVDDLQSHGNDQVSHCVQELVQKWFINPTGYRIEYVSFFVWEFFDNALYKDIEQIRIANWWYIYIISIKSYMQKLMNYMKLDCD